VSLTWAQFDAKVRVFLHQYNDVAAAQALIDVMIPAGVEDLQRTIDYYQTGHQDTYAAADLTAEGYAHFGSLPDGRINLVRMVKFDADEGAGLLPNVFRSLKQASWSRVSAMRGGEVEAFSGMIALDPIGRRFAVVPGLNPYSRLVIDWTGVKSDFADEDVTPFDTKAAEAVGSFVLSKLSRVIDRDAAQETAHRRDYLQLKKEINGDVRWNAVVDDQPESQLEGDEDYATTVTGDSMNALFSYKPLIAGLTGGADTDLDGFHTFGAVGTNSIFYVVISGTPQYWRLEAGTTEEDGVAYVRPDDYDAETNARVWVRIG